MERRYRRLGLRMVRIRRLDHTVRLCNDVLEDVANQGRAKSFRRVRSGGTGHQVI
jgi:hypothetical protein